MAKAKNKKIINNTSMRFVPSWTTTKAFATGAARKPYRIAALLFVLAFAYLGFSQAVYNVTNFITTYASDVAVSPLGK